VPCNGLISLIISFGYFIYLECDVSSPEVDILEVIFLFRFLLDSHYFSLMVCAWQG
jgi:hypothetical protein